MTKVVGTGVHVPRRFTTPGEDPYQTVEWVRRTSRITNPDGSVVFEMEDAEVPAGWSQVATDIMVSKYFRKAGVPQVDENGDRIYDEDGEQVLGPERSARQVVHRLVGTWRWWGDQHGYFASEEDAQAFEDELAYMLLHQMAAPNSPQWFNTGLNWAYGLTGPAQGFWYVDPETEELVESPDAYTHPAPHACFPAGTRISTRDGFLPIEKIQPGDEVLTHEGRYRPVRDVMQRQVDEDLVRLSIRKLSATDLLATANHPVLAVRADEAREARRLGWLADLEPAWIPAGELEPGDYVVVAQPGEEGPDVEELHVAGKVAYRVASVGREPFYGTVYNFEVEEDESYVADGVVVHNCFILSVEDDLVNPGGIMDLWVREARIFKYGSGAGSNFSKIRAEGELLSGGGKSSGLMSFLKIGDRAAAAIKSGGTTRRAAKMVIVDLDHPDIEAFVDWKVEEEKKARALIGAGWPSDFNGEAYQTISGQNSNNSVRVPNEFVEAVIEDGDWDLVERTTGKVRKTIKARGLWERIARAAWECADPGVQFDTTIQEWHTCPEGGRIRATNPCSEYVFLDNTACNLASLNLVTFYDDETGVFDIDAYRHAIRLWTMVLDISVTMAHFPSEEIAQGSYDYRTLGLGYANMGSLLMRSGLPYDSDEGRAIMGALTAVLTGESYATSAELAESLGPFPKYEDNREHMLRVIRNHRRAAYDDPQEEYEGVSHHVVGIDPDLCSPDLLAAARRAWDRALERGERHGYRNAQVSVLAPTGTIGLLMDCDTTGIEPDFALVKFKKLAGGGYFKIANQSIAPALRRLGYAEDEIEEVVRYVVGSNTLEGAPHVNRDTLAAKGFTEEELDRVEATLRGVFELRHAFNVFVVGEEALQRLGFTEDEYTSFDFHLLKALGFTEEQIREANDHICGRQTVEGAPHLREEDLRVFDCANKCGRYGQRFIHHIGHIRAMAAAQPFISGAISKTINMPNDVIAEDIEESYMLSWELGLKAMALYRDGSKASQPLSNRSDDGEADDEPEGVSDAIEGERKVLTGEIAPGVSPTQAYAGHPRPRFLLPARRRGWTREARIGGHKVFLRTGEYDDGTLGEIFIDLAKEGATLRGILSCFAIAVSKGLQYGVPLDEFVDTFTFHTFEPRGMVEGHPNIKMANSIVDYVFRAIGLEYLDRTDLVQVPPAEDDLPEPTKGAAAESGLQLDLTEAAMEADIEAQIEAAAFADRDEPPTNGSNAGNGAIVEAAVEAAKAAVSAAIQASDAGTASVQEALGEMMGDAPLCDTCGHITVRNGSCYKCLNCGNSLGCS